MKETQKSEPEQDSWIQKSLTASMSLDDALKKPPIMDFLAIKSTIPGFASYRLSSGSPFIQALREELTSEYLENKAAHKQTDLESIVKKVQSIVDLKLQELSSRRQTITLEASLYKYIKFRKFEQSNKRNPEDNVQSSDHIAKEPVNSKPKRTRLEEHEKPNQT